MPKPQVVSPLEDATANQLVSELIMRLKHAQNFLDADELKELRALLSAEIERFITP